MFYRNLAPVSPMILMSNQFHRRPEHQNHSNYGSGQFNSSHEEDGFFDHFHNLNDFDVQDVDGTDWTSKSLESPVLNFDRT